MSWGPYSQVPYYRLLLGIVRIFEETFSSDGMLWPYSRSGRKNPVADPGLGRLDIWGRQPEEVAAEYGNSGGRFLISAGVAVGAGTDVRLLSYFEGQIRGIDRCCQSSLESPVQVLFQSTEPMSARL